MRECMRIGHCDGGSTLVQRSISNDIEITFANIVYNIVHMYYFVGQPAVTARMAGDLQHCTYVAQPFMNKLAALELKERNA